MGSQSSIARSTTISRRPPPKFAARAYPKSMRPRSKPASGPAATCCLRKRFTNAAQPSSQAVRFGRARCDRRRHLAVDGRPFAPNFGRASNCARRRHSKIAGWLPLSVQERSCSDITAMTELTPKPTLGLPNGEHARTTITNAKEMTAEHREYPKRGNLVLFCPSIGLPSLPGAAPAFLSLIAWLECLQGDAWQLP